jgi:hypothetical protein
MVPVVGGRVRMEVLVNGGDVEEPVEMTKIVAHCDFNPKSLPEGFQYGTLPMP